MKDSEKDNLCFGLDIGTRTVIGVVGYKENNEFVILACEHKEHEERAMRDGQIHDIQKVAQTVYQIKDALEKKLNISLKEVAIAAAGRSLSTQITEVTHSYEEVQEFTLANIHHLELEGVEKAKEQQETIGARTDYYCVAYTTMNYYLDGYMMDNLEGHKGTSIGVKMISTFLPKQVIDSLYAVTERADLTVSHLTLEPIAAINAVIPENIRLLNLALVDIGAGTSDIAVTKDGSVIAYGMIPIAGDEVTEGIVHKYLVDFNTAEQMKQQIENENMISFTDILGLSQEVSRQEIIEVISPAINELTGQIGEKIKELNGMSSPNAVFCVGGGSQMYGVEAGIAQNLELATQRVALRTTEHLVKVRDEVGLMKSPVLITPIGICLTALQNKYSEFTMVTLNGYQVQLLNAKKLTILDAIVAAGIEHTAIFPGRGKMLMFKLNGDRIRIKGGAGMPALLMKNGKEATINDHIVEGDHIEVIFATAGENGRAYLKDYVEKSTYVTVNGEKILLPLVLVNGDIVDRDYEIQLNDEIITQEIPTLKALLEVLNSDQEGKIVTVNFEVKPLDYRLQAEDSILIDEIKMENAHTLEEKQSAHEGLKERLENENLYIMVNGQMVQLPFKASGYIFANIFDFIDFDLTKPQGTVQLRRNNAPAALIDPLINGDMLEIYWKK